MEAITQDTLELIKSREWTLLFVHADNCKFCQAAKPVVEGISAIYPNIQFLSGNLEDIHEYYKHWAEKVQETVFEPNSDDSEDIIEVPQFNEDGTPKMTVIYKVPCLLVHHSKAQTFENPYGYVGATDNASSDEIHTICSQILRHV